MRIVNSFRAMLLITAAATVKSVVAPSPTAFAAAVMGALGAVLCRLDNANWRAAHEQGVELGLRLARTGARDGLAE